MNGTLRTLALVAIVAVGAFSGATVAASDASLNASPATPGESSTHTATLTVGNTSTGSLNGFTMDYSNAGMNVSNVGVEDVVTVGIDRDDDASGATVDEDVSDDLGSVQHSNNGGTLTLKFGGSYSLNAGDEVVVTVETVENPSAGDYQVNLDINPQSSGGDADATLTISDSDSSSTETDSSADTETAADDSDTSDDSDSTDAADTESDGGNEMQSTDSDADSGGEESTSTDGPGFGAALTVLALLGAAFVAVRQRN
jgi:PGF-CTERM protein